MQSEGLAFANKTKLKTRADHANLVSIPEKKSVFSRWSRKSKEETEEEPQLESLDEKEGDKHSFFTKLSKKTKNYMHQLMNTAEDEKKGLAPMKWQNFLKVSLKPVARCTNDFNRL